MKTLTQNQAEKDLEPYLPLISTAIRNGFSDFLKLQQQTNAAGLPVEYSIRTKAGIIHDCTKTHIQNAFRSTPNVKVGVFNKLFGICIPDIAFIRFKKFKKDLSTSNVQTKQTKLYNQQTQIVGLPEAPAYLYAGYRPNATWTDLEDIFIVNRRSSVIEWAISLNKYSTEQVVIPFTINSPTEQPRVTIKPGLLEERKTS
ncbi:hypothetical protein SAMN04488109_4768 [Chryseolinea serpens]|uniref:Uncharacterized protein n=1 Tax=Chryseolinea serpens TaxID=947013 RepID=A0A1M5UMK4_9BACT|nr:hypothetical protein [Chryseolinea serpens]SHH63943.1 hypothetical protein SAMN04488109_4768 [Chryseolinea serpens]